MRGWWVRQNGQADLRDNLRKALKTAGLSQRAAADKAGMKYASLAGFFSANNWLQKADATALASALEIPLDELVGKSIFKDQRDRFAEFDYLPPKVQQWDEERRARNAQLEAERERELSLGRTRALCCACGALRTCSAKRYRWEPSLGGLYRPRDGHRVTEKLKCFDCHAITTHAVLLTSDDRDGAETFDRQPSRYVDAVGERDGFIKTLREFNVAVVYRRGWSSKKKDKAGLFYSSGYEFNGNTMQWEIMLDEHMPPRLQVTMMRQHWQAISTGNHGVEWDPRDGVGYAPTSTDWGATIDDLLKDIDRYIDVERHRLTLDARDEIAEASRTDNR